ncbi:PLP-dependent aminotransferase family protein [Photorhabdus noenieputensis]|uniref:MocR-like pyridoxine biosynthesis transcription factor PdxR n=1 Tax=Photorhabdus noenieputensis TaxID=1208607 RepID=UPI001BD4B32E|nr:PLP-dependent aminotransferase family protein [Photorhabdus noenieputensis]MBS9438253.1 PLP-dependent aminotransferase family protein [Photorhabdus noenieputensis]
MNLTDFSLNDKNQPLYQQIYQRFVQSIQQGVLIPGQRVPSIRTLASELQLSRSTVELAYGILVETGYLEARGSAGTIVSIRLEKLQTSKPATGRVFIQEDASVSLFTSGTEDLPRPYQLGLPALDLFPRKVWANLNTRHLRSQNHFLSLPQPAGYPPLREAIASYLQVSRGLSCVPQQVFITAGYKGALNLIGRTLIQPLDQIWIEDPCFPPSRQLLTNMGAELIPVPVDQDGLCVKIGKELAPKARFALVTPASQSPLGVSLSLERRVELLSWAKENNAFIIEDDYDSEYRYDGCKLPVLASAGSSDNVLYIGTFSKILSPSLRLGYLVVPMELLSCFNSACQTWQDGSPLLNQVVLSDFMKENHLSRHLRKTRAAYAIRRKMVIDSLRSVFGDRMYFDMPACGLHLLARLHHSENDVELVRRAKQYDISIGALSARAHQNDCGKGLLLGFANVTCYEQAMKQAQSLARLFD